MLKIWITPDKCRKYCKCVSGSFQDSLLSADWRLDRQIRHRSLSSLWGSYLKGNPPPSYTWSNSSLLENVSSKVSLPVADELVMRQCEILHFKLLPECFHYTLLSFLLDIYAVWAVSWITLKTGIYGDIYRCDIAHLI